MRLSLLDWRRRVHDLYEEVRASADPATGHEIWRVGRDNLLASHVDSPLLPEHRTAFRGLPIAPYDPALRFEAIVEPAEPLRFEVTSTNDGIVPFERFGVVRLDGLGSLDVWWLESYGGGVFLPVKDALAGQETYGGGRYLLDTVKGADLGGDLRDGVLIVDLNFAYNPSCAYDPAWVCPLAPPGNTLAVPTRAGELYPAAGAVRPS
jgi:uncharacterized protein (DUF1684 family)